jgi:hypothetical protein
MTDLRWLRGRWRPVHRTPPDIRTPADAGPRDFAGQQATGRSKRFDVFVSSVLGMFRPILCAMLIGSSTRVRATPWKRGVA